MPRRSRTGPTSSSGKAATGPTRTRARSCIAHELTHTIQQREAVQRSANVQVRERADGAQLQRWGLSDVLDWLADKANNIPGYRMFTILLGVNPINMSRVDRSAANILRAIVEFLPGGNLITRALDQYGVFEKAGAWIDQQLQTLGITGSLIIDALDRFLDSLGWTDIFHPIRVWERAKRIFTDPIDRIITFAVSLVGAIMRLIRDAILLPIARLASRTRAWDLLCAVLGRNPITGEDVPRNAETLIGGFMKLIGQEEIWENIKRANAIARAWAWFQDALGGLLELVRSIPHRFIEALTSLTLEDVIILPRAFEKVAGVFGGFLRDFVSWAGDTILSLLEIIFSVVAPSVMPYLRRAAGAFRTILRDPIRFVRNLVRAATLGFRKFVGRFLDHLRAALIGWLTGAMSGANVYIPQGLNLREIIKFVLSVLGVTWQNLREKLVRAIGETAVRALETGFDVVMTLVTQGPAAAWEKIQESLSNLREMVMEQIMTFVQSRVVQAAVAKLLMMLSPAGAFIQAIIAIYNTVMFFVERLRQIAQVAASFIDSIATIAAGSIAPAADRVEQTLVGLLTLVISFLARFAGLGRVSDAVTGVVNRVREPVNRALERVVQWIVETATRLGKLVAGAARGTAQRVMGWLGLRKQFSVESEAHSLSFSSDPSNPVLMLASSPEHILTWLNRRLEELTAARRNNDTKRAAGQAIQQDVQSLRELTYPREGAAPAADPTPQIQELLDRISTNVATIGFGDGGPVPPMVVTPGFGSQKSGDMTVQFLFMDRGNHRPGTPTSGREDLGGAWTVLARLGISRSYWKSGHMLNASFGGQATNSNLIPIPQSVNRSQEANFDGPVERDLYSARKVIALRFTVQRNHAEESAAPTEGGPHFVSYFKAEAGEMPWNDGRYEQPSSFPYVFEKSGADLPYPARRTSVLTLNGIISAKDSSRDSVRSVAAATQLSETLVEDLVRLRNGVPLGNVGDIETFIKSRSSDYGAVRTSRYLVAFQRIRAGITL